MNRIEFKKLPLPPAIEPIYFDVYYVTENQRSPVMSAFGQLPEDLRDHIKSLITNMATIKNYKHPHIRYNLRGYNYGEIKPRLHRFFFFQKGGNNYIFFDYKTKKSGSLDDRVYRDIAQKKEKYENAFQRFLQRN